MISRFDRWFEWLMTWEGTVYENDPDDAGGATKYGIDQRSHPRVNIRGLTLAQARDIYLDETWHHLDAEELPPGVGEVVCNIAVNCGKGKAVEWLQAAVKAKVDGWFGPETLRLSKAANAAMLCAALLDRTEQYYRGISKLRKNKKFLKGWLNRNDSLRTFIHPLLAAS